MRTVRCLCAALALLVAVHERVAAQTVDEEEHAVQAWGAGHADCPEWSDGCVTCRRPAMGAADAELACSLPGIACVPAKTACRAPVVAKP